MKIPSDIPNRSMEPLGRREFMKTVSAAGLGLAAGKPLLSEQTAGQNLRLGARIAEARLSADARARRTGPHASHPLLISSG